jgi:hypothetical protein
MDSRLFVAAIEPDRDRTVINERHFHIRTKYSGLDVQSSRNEQLDKDLVEQLGLLRPRGVNVAGTAALAAVAIKSELADDQHAAADFRYREIHFAVGVVEEAQARDLLRHEVGSGGIVRMGDPQQHEQPALDGANYLAFHLNARSTDSLDAGSHDYSTSSPLAARIAFT